MKPSESRPPTPERLADPAEWPSGAFAYDLAKRQWWTAAQLHALDQFSTLAQRHALIYRPLVQVVPGVLFEGYNVLSASPKVGKTILATQLVQSVVEGTDWLGRACRQGPVLVYALEDNTPGVVRRERRIMRGAVERIVEHGGAIDVVCALEQPGLQDLRARLSRGASNGQPYVLVVIDTSPRFTGFGAPTSNAYERGLETIAPLDRVGLEHHVAILGIHHDRQSDAEDWFEKINGASSITGSAQCVMALRRSRGTNSGVLMVGPREGEEQTFSLMFDDGLWQLDPDVPAEIAREAAGARREVLSWLWDRDSGATLADIIQAHPQLSYDNVRQAVLRLTRSGAVICDKTVFSAVKPVIAPQPAPELCSEPAAATPSTDAGPEPLSRQAEEDTVEPPAIYQRPAWYQAGRGPIATFNHLMDLRQQSARKPAIMHPYGRTEDIPEPLRLLGRGQGTGVHEGSHRWILPDDQAPADWDDETRVLVLDKNAAFLAALGAAKLPMGPLQHYPGVGPAGQRGIHRLDRWPDWTSPLLPHPLGQPPKGRRSKYLWITSNSLDLLGQNAVRCGPFEVCESFTAAPLQPGKPSWLRLESIQRTLTDALYEARETEDQELIDHIKGVYSVGISTAGESASNTNLWRPDWPPGFRSMAYANLWRAGNRLSGHTAVRLVGMTGVDELHVVGDPWGVFQQGRHLYEWKMKDSYRWGDRARR